MKNRRPLPPPGHPAAGWTLLELMMVVALIGILAAVALPMYGNYRNRVRVTSAAQDITVMSMAVKSYWLDNGVYPDSLTTIGMAASKDPWGYAYVYYNIDANGKGHARKDRALNPLNTDFDLYSIGADGVTKSQVSNKDSLDDVIRARNGGFIGKAEDF
jgi:general secretion pathway protein G